MVSFVKSIILTIVFIQIISARHHFDDDDDDDDDDDGDISMHSYKFDHHESSFHSNRISDDLRTKLTNILYPGNTFSISELSHTLIDSRKKGNSYSFRFRQEIMNYFNDRLFIGELTQLKTVNKVDVLFYDQSDRPVLDKYGDIIRYTSNIHDLGHALELIQLEFSFSSIEFLLKLQPEATFNKHNLFFHFSHTSSGTDVTGRIIGPTLYVIGSRKPMYTVTKTCPLGIRCGWFLNNDLIFNGPDTSVALDCNENHIGNPILSYVSITNGITQILASLTIRITFRREQSKLSLNLLQ
ncbi:hypothetical protein I4U23_015324 [Adineta vaga]|nr:hypothetical protein I4U23_015324 [Adineta vaga]